MYGTTTTAAAQPSRVRRILTGLVFTLIGAGITFAATGYYWSGKYKEGYTAGMMQGKQQGHDEAVAQQQEESAAPERKSSRPQTKPGS